MHFGTLLKITERLNLSTELAAREHIYSYITRQVKCTYLSILKDDLSPYIQELK